MIDLLKEFLGKLEKHVSVGGELTISLTEDSNFLVTVCYKDVGLITEISKDIESALLKTSRDMCNDPVLIFGVELMEGFSLVVEREEWVEKCLEVWDEPTRFYPDGDFTDNSAEAYAEFTSHLWVKLWDGKEIKLEHVASHVKLNYLLS